MLEMASLGAKVLQTRSVEIAMLHRVPTRVLSTFDPDAGGTLLCDEEDIVEKKPVTGIAYSRDEAKITLHKIPDRPGIAAAIFGPLADSGVNVDMIVQNVSTAGHTDISFTIPRTDLSKTSTVMDKLVVETEAHGFRADTDIGRVSLIGAGMKTHPGIAARMFEVLADNGINIEMISTSTIRISCVVREADVEPAVRALHRAFALEAAS